MTYDLKKQTPNMFSILAEVGREEGIKGLFRGAQLRMVYLFVGGAAFFGIYEKVRKQLLETL